MKIVHNLPNTVADRKYKKYGKSMISYSTFEIEWHWNTFLGVWFTQHHVYIISSCLSEHLLMILFLVQRVICQFWQSSSLVFMMNWQ